MVPTMRLLTAIPVHNEERYLEDVLREVLGTPRMSWSWMTARPTGRPSCSALSAVKDDPASAQPGLRGRVAHGVPAHDRGGLRRPGDARLRRPARACRGSPSSPAGSKRPTSSRAAATSQVFDPTQRPPEERRRINVEVTRWLNECLGLNLTDAFCGFKAYRKLGPRGFDITDNGYAMPLQVWVQAVQHGLTIVEVAVPLIYLDESRAFGGALDDAAFRLKHYQQVFQEALERAGLEVAGGCRG